jgi:hypothetical protein
MSTKRERDLEKQLLSRERELIKSNSLLVVYKKELSTYKGTLRKERKKTTYLQKSYNHSKLTNKTLTEKLEAAELLKKKME